VKPSSSWFRWNVSIRPAAFSRETRSARVRAATRRRSPLWNDEPFLPGRNRSKRRVNSVPPRRLLPDPRITSATPPTPLAESVAPGFRPGQRSRYAACRSDHASPLPPTPARGRFAPRGQLFSSDSYPGRVVDPEHLGVPEPPIPPERGTPRPSPSPSAARRKVPAPLDRGVPGDVDPAPHPPEFRNVHEPVLEDLSTRC